MTEHGGPTTQSGILYQNSLAALYLGRLLDVTERPENQRVSRVRIESPDHVDDIVITYADQHKAYIQAKEALTYSGKVWEKLWQSFNKQFCSNSFQKGRDKLCLHVGNLQAHIEDLVGLFERAQESESYEELLSTRLIGKQKTLLRKIESNLDPELTRPETTLDFLQHIEVQKWTLNHIERDLVPVWMPDSNKSVHELFRLLRDRVGGKAKIRGSFAADDLRNSLKLEDPQIEFVTTPDIEALYRAVHHSGDLLRLHKHTVGNTGYHIPRPIVENIVNWVTETDDDQKNVTMLLDQAGLGKTVVMRDVLIELENQGVAVLAIKADQQLSGITSLSEIQDRLELTHPAESCIERLAKLGRVAILIDQIDALSLTLAHDQRTLNVVLDLIARLRRIPNVRIVISCRLFDRNSDPRLRQIEATEPFRLSKLEVEEIRAILTQVNIEYDALAKPTRELLNIPLHLDLFVYAVENNAESGLVFKASNLQELYGLIWENVVLKQDPQGPRVHERVKALNHITDYMDREQTTTVPLSRFYNLESAELEKAISWLASAGIIIRGKVGWSFLHQTFFDYCYAQHFVDEGGDIVKVILASEQGIFERTKLIQVISHLRGINSSQYLKVLHQLLTINGIRHHLKDLTVRWLGSIPEPLEGEWVLMQQFLSDAKIRPALVNAVNGNVGWFLKLKEPFLKKWLLNDDTTDGLAIPYLISMLGISQLDVIGIVRPFLGKTEKWDARIAAILSRIRTWDTSEAIDLYEHHFMRWPSYNRLYQLVDLADVDPVAGCRLIKFTLDHLLKDYLEYRNSEIAELGESYVYSTPKRTLYSDLASLDHSHLDAAIKIVYERDPKAFIAAMLPWIGKAVSIHGVLDNDRYGFAWDELSIDWHGDTFTVGNAITQGLVHSLIQVAKTDFDYCNRAIDKLEALPHSTPQLILANAYAIEPELFVDKACEFLLADRRRLDLGIQQYDTRQLIKRIYPYLSAGQRTRLEAHILSFAPIYKSSGVEGLRHRGIEQLYILQSISPQYLSPTGLRRLEEWKRKFPGVQASEKPIRGEGGMVSSPIPPDIAAKMSDRDWLRAMQKYRKGIEHKEFLKGGARELSNVLGYLTLDYPVRFVRLFERVPDDVDDAYIASFIDGLTESTAPTEWLFSAIRRFARQEGRNIQRDIARSLAKKTNSDEIPDDLVELLIDWLDKPSGEDEWWWSKGDNHGDSYQSYLNSDRGAAFHTLMRIYDAQDTEDVQLKKWNLVEFAANDSSPALRIGAIHELTFMIRHDRARAISMFDLLMNGHDRLIESIHVRQFIYYGFYKNYLHFHPYISSMMQDDSDAVKEQGAQLACIAALSMGALESDLARAKARDLAHLTLSGPPAWRKGAAFIYSHNLSGEAFETCKQNLLLLLEDDDEQVLRYINSIFSLADQTHFLPMREFIETYVSTVKVFDHNFSEYLLNHGLLAPDWALIAIRTYIASAKRSAQPVFIGVEELLRLVLQIYTYSMKGEKRRADSMDVFDLLMEDYSTQALQILDEWDS